MKVKLLSHVQLLAASWTAAYQAPLSMGFSRQEYWSGVPLLSPIILPYSPANAEAANMTKHYESILVCFGDASKPAFDHRASLQSI